MPSSNLQMPAAVNQCPTVPGLPTCVMVEYDIKQILVAPGDVKFILLEEGHEHLVPSQWNGCHVVLLEGKHIKDLLFCLRFKKCRQRGRTTVTSTGELRWNRSYLKEFLPDSGHVHQHDPGVDASKAVVRVPGEAVVPANPWLLVFGGHGGQVAGIEAGEEGPDLVHGMQEEDVRVHVQHRVHVRQDQLENKSI